MSKVAWYIERYLATVDRQVRTLYEDEGRAHYAARLRATALIAFLFVPFFYGLDLITWAMVDPSAPIGELTTGRVLIGVIYWQLGAAIRRRAYGPRGLLFLDLAIFVVLCLFEGYLCLRMTGIGSTYYAGIMLAMMVRGMLVPSTILRTAGIMLAGWGTWAGIMLVAVPLDARIAAQFANRQDLGMFLSNNFFILVGFGTSMTAAIIMYSLRRTAAEALRIGRYRLKRCLGRGGMGEVYLAEIGALRRPCAIKIIGRSTPISDIIRQRFEREAMQTSTLTHPHTIGIFDFGETDTGVLYYAMEFLDGLDLGEILRLDNRLRPERAVHFMLHACSSLHDAHKKHIVHRDIKPENFFVTGPSSEPDFLKVLDFGLAKAIAGPQSGSELTADHSVIGTPLYMSPEACQGHPVDVRSDVYSIGAVLYHLLTGTPVHKAETPMATMVAHLTLPVEPPSARAPGASIPRDVEGIVMKALARSPEHRHQSAEELRQALSDCSVSGEWSRSDADAWWAEHANNVRAIHDRRAEQATDSMTIFDPGAQRERRPQTTARRAQADSPGQLSMTMEASGLDETGISAPVMLSRSRADSDVESALSDLYSASWLLDVAAMRAHKPTSIVFVCRDNAAVSLMAEAIARSVAPAHVLLRSAGHAAHALDDTAVQVMREIGIEIAKQSPKALESLTISSSDAVIFLAPERPEARLSGAVFHWPMPPCSSAAPTLCRAVRDELLHRMRVLFA